MKPRAAAIAAATLLCLYLTTCGGQDPRALTELPNEASSSAGPTDESTAGQSVADVITGSPAPGQQPSQLLPPSAAVSARVRNESGVQADVTVRFIREDTIVHLAFVRVLPLTVTTVISPSAADSVELSGIDQSGRALAQTTLVLGSDSNEPARAEYVISDPLEDPADPTDPGDPTDPLDPGTRPPVHGAPIETTLTLFEPQSDITLTLGSVFAARWEDTSASSDATVALFLRPVEAADSSELISVGPPVGAAVDGINDQLLIILQNLVTGLYEVVAQIDDGTEVLTSVAPGLLNVVVHPDNIAPTLSILSPDEIVELRNGDSLTVEWDDADPDGNATIIFSLVGTDAAPEIGVGTFRISPPMAEDPDGPEADIARLTIEDLLPGRYTLLGTIDDGELVGSAQLNEAVRILPPPGNDPPQLELLQPNQDVYVEVGGSFLVRWDDSDLNDNARVSLLLDPDLTQVALDGNEVLLVASLGEDQDGAADEITLGVPAETVAGTYRLVGVITDGLIEVVTFAPGQVGITAPDSGDHDVSGPQEMVLSEPSGDVHLRTGDSLVIRIDTVGVPATADVRVFLTNEAYGGQLRLDITPPDLLLDEERELTLPAVEDIPNHEWPRQFELLAEAAVDNEELSTTAPGLVWIRQEVELAEVRMVNYACSVTDRVTVTDSPFIGLEISWGGGGFGNWREMLEPVQFWLSKDQAIPQNNEDDAYHRMMYDGDLESPGLSTRLTRIDLAQAFGIDVHLPEGAEIGELEIPLNTGEYYVMAVVETVRFGRVVSPAYPQPIEVCLPILAPQEFERH